MANVRYMGGGSAATLGTKDIVENGIYNASDDDLDGYSRVTVEVPEPSGTVSLAYNANGVYTDVDVKEYEEATVTVNVPEPQSQTKTVTATTSQQTVTPDAGYLLSEVTVNPQQNAGTYTPTPNTAANDMGPVNSYRYVNTSGMIQPTGTKSISIDSNGEYAEGVTSYDNVAITVDVPISGTLGSKSIIANGIYTALDDNLDGYSELNVNVPQNATLGIKSITTNGNYYATADGYDGFSRVDVNVAGSALQANKNVTATTSQQIVTPDQGYDGLEQVTVNPQVHTQTYTPAQNTAANDMGAQNNYRYVNTSGMIVPSGNKSITANGTGIDVSAYATASVAVPDPTLTGNATAADVKSGKTFYSNSLTKQTGTYTPGFNKTILWSNPNPTSNFSAQSVSLNDNLSNYDYIEVGTIWNTSSNQIHVTTWSYNEFTYYNNQSIGAIGGYREGSSGNNRTRGIYASDDTHVYIGNSYQQTSGSQTASAAYIIPYHIRGCNFK